MTESLIDTVARLKELEAKSVGNNWAPGYRETECIAEDGGRGNVVLRRTNGGSMPVQENIDLMCCLRNAASALIGVLGEIQPGDAEKIAFATSGEYLSEGCRCDRCREATEVLRRYQAMASHMAVKGHE